MIDSPDPDYHLIQEEGHQWTAVHVETGIASHGSSPTEAVEMTAEAVELHQQDHTPGDDEYQRMMLDQFDIDL